MGTLKIDAEDMPHWKRGPSRGRSAWDGKPVPGPLEECPEIRSTPGIAAAVDKLLTWIREDGGTGMYGGQIEWAIGDIIRATQER